MKCHMIVTGDFVNGMKFDSVEKEILTEQLVILSDYE